MHKLKILYNHRLKEIFKSKSFLISYLFFLGAILIVSYSSVVNFEVDSNLKKKYQEIDRLSWENNPDKHPHRMAHYGSFAIKKNDPLSFFDPGVNNYVGSIIYLEAHKQNTANFAQSSTLNQVGFMDLTLSNLVKIVLPLLLIIIGYRCISYEREKGILKMLLIQNTSIKQIFWSSFFALQTISLLFLIPVFITVLFFFVFFAETDKTILSRSLLLFLIHVVYLQIVCLVIIYISFYSKNSMISLFKLTSIWFIFVLILPKTIHAIIEDTYKIPSKIAIETSLSKKLSKIGDSHNPEDKYFKKLKDSVLKVNEVDSIDQLSFNYGGFVMKVGEKIYSKIYKEEIKKCNDVIIKQNDIFTKIGFLNPFILVHTASSNLSYSNYESHLNFQNQAEDYRYYLAQKMNDLQIKYISNKKLKETDKPYVISKKHWLELKKFDLDLSKQSTILVDKTIPLIIGLFVWFLGLVFFSIFIKEKL